MMEPILIVFLSYTNVWLSFEYFYETMIHILKKKSCDVDNFGNVSGGPVFILAPTISFVTAYTHVK